MSTAIPIQRSSRQVTQDATAGQTVFTFDAGVVWDVLDIVVKIKVAPATRFTTITTGFTVALLSGGLSGASVTFAVAPRPGSGDPATQVRIASKRVHERSTDVSRSNRLHTPSFETEADKVTTTLQELRRDVDGSEDLAREVEERLVDEIAGVVLGQIPDETITDPKVKTPASLAEALDTAKMKFLQAGTGAVLRPARTKMREVWHIRDFITPGRAMHESFNYAFEAVGEDTSQARKILQLDPITYDIEQMVSQGNGNTTRVSTYHGVTVQGVGGSQERLRRGIALSGQMTRIRWQGPIAGRMWDIAGPVAGMKLLDVFLDGNTNDVAGGELTPRGADYLLRVLSLQGGATRVHLGSGRNTLMEVNTQQISNANIVLYDGYAARGNTLNDFWVNFDANEYVDGFGVTGILIDGWTGNIPAPDPCKINLDVWGYVNATTNAGISDPCADFAGGGGRAGIGLDLRFCDSIDIKSLWLQSGGTPGSPTRATSVMMRGRIADGDGARYPIHVTMPKKWQAGQHLPVRVDTSTAEPGGNFTAGIQEVDGEIIPRWPVTKYIGGFKPESVNPGGGLSHIAKYGLQEITDEDRNSILNPGLTLARRGTSFTNPANNTRLFDAGHWLERDGTMSSVISRQAFTPGQVAVPLEPEFYGNVNITAASGMSTNGLAWGFEDVIRHSGRKFTFSIFLKSTVSFNATLFAVQVMGSGGSPSGDVVVNAGLRSIGTSWSRHEWTIDMPSLSGKTLGTARNHWVKLLLSLPINTVCSIDYARPQFEQGEAATRPYLRSRQEELLRALPYLREIPAPGTLFGYGPVIGGNVASLQVPLNPPMYKAPSLAVTGAASAFVLRDADGTNTKVCDAVPYINYADTQMAQIGFQSTAHGFAVGKMLQITHSGSGALLLSAEVN